MVKKRPQLPRAYQSLYVGQYKKNRHGKAGASRLSRWAEAWMHRKVAEDSDGSPTLEIGAGTLNHIAYENASHYDIVEPFKELFEESPEKRKVRNVWRDIAEVPTYHCYYRIVSIATFEHLEDLDSTVRNASYHLWKGGVLRVAIPNEGCWLWTLGWRLTTGLEFWMKHGLDYGVLMRHEHLNTADEIEKALKWYFRNVKVKYFGLGRHFSLYRFYECSRPIGEK